MAQYPTIVAEISGNHNGGLDRALKLVEEAKFAGADLVKIQTYTPDTITLPVKRGKFVVPESHPLWGGRSLYDLYEEAHTPLDWHSAIFKKAADVGIGCFSTPFDESSVAFLEDLGVSIYKIASLEIVDLPLIREVAKTGKPIVISTGAASLSEIERAVDAARSGTNRDITLLVCTSAYPAPADESNLRRIPALAELFDAKVGFSDHTLGNIAALTATALGATMIEKHLTLSRSDGGVDADFSAEPAELRALCLDTKTVIDSLGKASVWKSKSEGVSFDLRPSLYVTADVKAGQLVSPDNVRSVRPSGGLAPDAIDLILGKAFKHDAHAGDPTSWGMFS